MKARFKYRLYPTEPQRLELARLFGCCRVVWNDALVFCQAEYLESKRKPSYPELSKRKSRQSARFMDNGFKLIEGKLKLPFIGELKVIWSRELPSYPTSVTIIKDGADRYFASFVIDFNPAQLPSTDNSVGIDLGIIDFATLSNGEKVKAPKPLKKKLKKLKRLQGKFSRTTKGSKRRETARKKVAKLHAKQKCSCCGESAGKKELSVREWTCLFCGVTHDRDVNASVNILNVAVGHTETKNGRGESVRLSAKKAVFNEASNAFKRVHCSSF